MKWLKKYKIFVLKNDNNHAKYFLEKKTLRNMSFQNTKLMNGLIKQILTKSMTVSIHMYIDLYWFEYAM